MTLEQFEKIFIGVGFVVLIALLLLPRATPLPSSVANQVVGESNDNDNPVGPAYLTANLPWQFAAPVAPIVMPNVSAPGSNATGT